MAFGSANSFDSESVLCRVSVATFVACVAFILDTCVQAVPPPDWILLGKDMIVLRPPMAGEHVALLELTRDP